METGKIHKRNKDLNARIFQTTHRDAGSKARTGVLSLGHGDVVTPAFMPVGTNGTVKGIYHEKVARMGYNLILGNTFHLYLRPGLEVLSRYSGLHRFSHWDGNILTDSGGFQIFSLPGLRRITQEGAHFQSPIDGSRHFFSPEKVVDIQHVIGSDIAMVLDWCTPPDIEHGEALKAWRMTYDWAKRSLARRNELGEEFKGCLFGIVQGNFYKDLRKESAQAISEMDFPGLAIGGLSVGEKPEVFKEFLAYTAAQLPDEKPRYVMGIGSPDYLMEAMENGIDLFDCVLATRMARNGTVFTDDGPLVLKRSFNEFDMGPISEGCQCTACRDYSRGYLRHLFKCGEMLGGMLATEHNLAYLHDLVEKARQAIREDRFIGFKAAYLARYMSNKYKSGK
ncbi:MAG: tRNA guanosine(34) transglycosylase Tgt [Sphaerochaetaceae bacterium]